MNLAPTPDEIRRNDEERRRIYEEQDKSMTSQEWNGLENALRAGIEDAITDKLVDFETKYDEQDERIEELEAANEANQALAESLAEQLTEAKNALLEIEEKGLNI